MTRTLITHPAVKKINFTGSTTVGVNRCRISTQVPEAHHHRARWKGQCNRHSGRGHQEGSRGLHRWLLLVRRSSVHGNRRVIVYSSIADSFVPAFKQSTNSMCLAPLFVTANGAKKTEALVKSALLKGASVVFGDLKESTEPNATSCWMRPIILTNAVKDSVLHENESFGPAVAISTSETQEEALAIANDTDYGLSGAVVIENLATGLRIATAYETGAVHINTMAIHDENSLPHGGVKKSGFGRFNGLPGLEEFLKEQGCHLEGLTNPNGTCSKAV